MPLGSFAHLQNATGEIGLVHRGLKRQRGYGIGSWIGRLIGKIIPVARKSAAAVAKTVKKVASSDVGRAVKKAAKEAAIEGGIGLASDVLAGTASAESVGQRLGAARKKIATALEDSIPKATSSARKRTRPKWQPQRRKPKPAKRSRQTMTNNKITRASLFAPDEEEKSD